ncbi:SPW repeat protein [Mesorhizobium sp. 1B3]|uniref:SPW repeat protein n=1 Tax=Mesorhizobium sp. 1B3 TaxID=3243599 RepID=UPI003D99B9EC
MATTDRTGRFGLMEHRSWEDILTMILGFVIMISPMFRFFGDAGGDRRVVGITALVGAAIIVISALEQYALRRWEEFLVLVAGIWMIISPYVLNYTGTLRTWHVILGAAVGLLALLELWQDRNRSLTA